MSNALLSGVTGLMAHQQMIDVAGNNLANVNTTAFKSSRVTFAEMISETLKDASAPTSNLGGTNPMQAGSGVVVSSIDRNMSQGSLVYTGNVLDVAVEGAGYFVLSDGQGMRYTRVGQFAVDSEFYLVDPTTGYRVQRYIGSQSVGETNEFQDPASNNIRIPYDTTLQPRETSLISFSGNLTGNISAPSKNLLSSELNYTTADGSIASLPTELSVLSQTSGLTHDDTVRIQGSTRAGNTVDCYYRYNDGTGTVERAVLDTGNAVTELQGTTSFLTNTDVLAKDLTVSFAGGTITMSIPASTTWDAATFKTQFDAAAGVAGVSAEAVYAATPGNQMVIQGTGAAGATSNAFSITNEDSAIKWGAGGAGDAVIGAIQDYHHWDGVNPGDEDTLGDFMNWMSAAFNDDGQSVSQASISNGSIRLEDVDAGYSLAQIDTLTYGGGGTFTLPTQFDIITAGGDYEKPVNIEIFDEQGNNYTMSGAFVRTNTDNTWDFVVKSLGTDVVLTDRRCQGITFLPDGTFRGIEGTDSMAITMIYPTSPDAQQVVLDFGTQSERNGLTQFGGTSTAVANGQDGYAAGWLSSLSIGREGTIMGAFSNDIRSEIATLEIATFQNPAALKSLGGNYYASTANSGDPQSGMATEGAAGVCHGGAVEKSNVEVAGEFVKLIEAQNGYQASARTIKVANEMLRELTGLIR